MQTAGNHKDPRISIEMNLRSEILNHQKRSPDLLFPQPSRNSPAAKLGFWRVIGLQSYIAKHVVCYDNHFSHDRTPLCCFVAFPICPRNEKTDAFFPRNYPATTVSQILSWPLLVGHLSPARENN